MILEVEKRNIVWNSFKTVMQKSVSEIEKAQYFRNSQILHARFRHSVGKASGGLKRLSFGPVWASAHIPISEESLLGSVTTISLHFCFTLVFGL